MFSTKLEFALLGTLALGAALVIANHGSVQAASGLKNQKDRRAAPDFMLTDSRGSQVRLADYKGKVVVLNFWATWCGPCKAEIPWFAEFESKYKNSGLAVLGISMDDDGWKSVRPFIAQTRMNYRVMVGDDATASRFGGIDSLPETLLIDRQGRIAARQLGLHGQNDARRSHRGVAPAMTRPCVPMSLLALCLVSLSAVHADAGDLVANVRALAAQGQYSKASGYVHAYEARYGQSPELILALSWLGRDALARKQFDLADQYAQDTYKKAQQELRKKPLDSEPDLPLALGASIEIQGQVLAARGQRTEAISMLETELHKYPGTPLAVRIRKNINLLSLEGKPAPPLEGVALPKGKPVLLFFWAHWCGDCRAEAPILAQLKKEFGPRGLAVIGATRKYGYIGSQTNVPPGVETSYIEQIRKEFYAAVVDAPPVVNETNFLTYGVSTTPTLALVDRGGIVRLYRPGGMKYDELKAAIESMMAHP